MLAEAAAGTPFWQDYWSVQTDPAHLLSELGFSILFEAIQAVVIYVLWRKVIKPRWFAQAHEQFDAAHGLTHVEEVERINKITYLQELAREAEEDGEYGTQGWLNAVEDGLSREEERVT
jgi:hypothetical protein